MFADDTDNAAARRGPRRSDPCTLRTAGVLIRDAESGYGLFNSARRLIAAVAATALPPRLFVLTRNAQPCE
jgi:hypothetical protein